MYVDGHRFNKDGINIVGFIKHNNRVLAKLLRYQLGDLWVQQIVIGINNNVRARDCVASQKVRTVDFVFPIPAIGDDKCLDCKNAQDNKTDFLRSSRLYTPGGNSSCFPMSSNPFQ